MARVVQIHPSTQPTWRTDRIRFESGRPDYSGGSSSPETDSGGSGFGFPPLKPEKPEPTKRFPDSSQNFQNSAKKLKFQRKNPDSDDIFPDSGSISLRSDGILTESGEISSNPVRFSPNLAKSHWIRWDFRRICVFSTVFSPSWIRPTHPPPVDVLNRPTWLLWRVGDGCLFFPPDFVSSRLGTNPNRTDPWIALAMAKESQQYEKGGERNQQSKDHWTRMTRIMVHKPTK